MSCKIILFIYIQYVALLYENNTKVITIASNYKKKLLNNIFWSKILGSKLFLTF
jgi:hypothetical protein